MIRPTLRLPHISIHRAGDLLMVLMVIGTYVTVLGSPGFVFTTPQLVGFIMLGVVYMVFGIWGAMWVDKTDSRVSKIVFFTLSLSLAAVINVISRGNAWLILMPLVGQTVSSLSRRWSLVVLAIIVAIGLFPFQSSFGNQRFVGQILIGLLSGIAFVALFTEMAVRSMRARDEIQRLAQELAEANRKLREYAAQVEELATTRERNRLAREIHDGLGHYLTVVNVQLEASKALLDLDPARAREALTKAQTLTQEGLAEVRRSVASLRTLPTENRSLPEALQSLINETRAVGIDTDLTVSGPPRSLSPQADLALYRAAQEGLTNIRKHAQATVARLTLDYGADRVALQVSDNGIGVNGQDQGGFGLLGVRERVGLLGGEVRIGTNNGQGFALQVEIPA